MPFATPEDIATRLGRELDATEAATAEALIGQATSLIASTVGQDDAWADALDPVPAAVHTVTVEAVARVMLNPQGVVATMRQLGSFQHQQTFSTDRDGMSFGLALTRDEKRTVRQAVNGRLTAVTLSSFPPDDDTTGDELDL